MGSRKWYQSHTENQVGLDLYISDMLYSLRVTFKKKMALYSSFKNSCRVITGKTVPDTGVYDQISP